MKADEILKILKFLTYSHQLHFNYKLTRAIYFKIITKLKKDFSVHD